MNINVSVCCICIRSLCVCIYCVGEQGFLWFRNERFYEKHLASLKYKVEFNFSFIRIVKIRRVGVVRSSFNEWLYKDDSRAILLSLRRRVRGTEENIFHESRIIRFTRQCVRVAISAE